MPVHPQMVRATDSETVPAASAAAISGCAAARRTHAVYPTAAPLVIRVLWISQARGL